MDYAIGFVQTGDVDQVWYKIKPYAERITDRVGGRVTLGSFYEDLINNRQSLWLAYRTSDRFVTGFCTSRLVDYPGARLLSLDMLAGDDLDGWIDQMHEAVEQWAKGNGCDGMEAAGRAGWYRKLKNKGWKQTISIVEKRW